jgi:hypothetical protein
MPPGVTLDIFPKMRCCPVQNLLYWMCWTTLVEFTMLTKLGFLCMMSHQTIYLAKAQTREEWENTLSLSWGANIAPGGRDISRNWNTKVHYLPQNSPVTSPCVEPDELGSRPSTPPFKCPLNYLLIYTIDWVKQYKFPSTTSITLFVIILNRRHVSAITSSHHQALF